MKTTFRTGRWLTAALTAMALLTMPMWASATPVYYTANLTPLNDSGVSGTANLTLNKDEDTLKVHISATGLLPDKSHPQHIHGTFDSSGNPTNATTPTLAVDSNGDGVIEVGEGAATYGPILVPLTNDSGDFPTAPDGTINFTQTYDLTDSSIFFKDEYEAGDLFPLFFREIVLHGLVTPVDITDNLFGASFDAGEYDPFLPVASGVIVASATVVPGPGSLLMMITGLGLLLGFMGWHRKQFLIRTALS